MDDLFPPQYHDSKISTLWVTPSSKVITNACEEVPFDLSRQWSHVDFTTPTLAGTQVPPMATYLAAPTMADAVRHTVRVAGMLEAMKRS